MQTKPAFVLVWLLGFYVVIALVETLLAFPKRKKNREPLPSQPPT